MRRVGPLGAYLAVTVALFHEAWAAPTKRFIGLRGDPDQTLWFLAWSARAVRNGTDPLFSDHMFYPDGVNLMWNAAVPLPALLVSPITLVGGPTLAYNVLMTLAFALSSWAAYRACVHFGAGPAAAWIGGLLYGFSPFMIARALGHLNIAIAFLPPLMLILLDRVARFGERPRRSGLLIGLAMGMQMLIWSETALIMAIGSGAYLVALLVVERDRASLHVRRVRDAFPAIVAGGLAVGIWPVLVFLFGPARPVGQLHPLGRSATRLANLVVPSAAHQFAPRAAREITERFSTGLGGRSAYIGLPLIALLGWAVVRMRRDVVTRVMCVGAGIALVLSLDPAIQIGGRSRTLLTSIPIINHLLPHRLMVLVFLFIAVTVARFLSASGSAKARERVVVAVGVVLVVLSFLPRLPFPATEEGVPPSFRAAEGTIPDGSVAIVLPAARAFAWQAATGMRYRSPTGRAFASSAGGVPKFLHTVALFERDGAIPSSERAAEVRAELRAADVERVLLVPVERDAQAEADRAVYGHGPSALTRAEGDMATVDALTGLLGTRPDRVSGAWIWSLPI